MIADYRTRSKSRIWLDASIDESIDRSIIRERGSAPKSDVTDGVVECRSFLAQLLRSSDAPTYLVLDNLTSDQLLRDLGGIPSSTIFIWTAQRFIDGCWFKPQLAKLGSYVIKCHAAQSLAA
jgi:hypothetical protein